MGERRKSLGRLIGAFKTVSMKRINKILNISKESIWQRSFYEHVIRDEHDLIRIREYIFDNPNNCEKDEYYNL